MERLENLYSRDSKGNIIEWEIMIFDNEEEAIITTLSGRFKSELTPHCRTIREGKNIGKSNQTTPFQQAIKEAKSSWNNKKKEGYKSLSDIEVRIKGENIYYKGVVINDDFENILDMALPVTKTDANDVTKPMKCQPYRRGKMSYPCIGQPKINGNRCVSRYMPVKDRDLFNISDKSVFFTSKGGEDYPFAHLKSEMEKLHIKYPDFVFDGEAYKQKTPVTSISGACRNPLNPLHKELMFWIFDLSIANMTQEARSIEVEKLIGAEALPYAYVLKDGTHNHYDLSVTTSPIVILSHVMLYSDNEAEDYRNKCIAAGYEGCVIRELDALYKFGSRPMNMMKLKEYIDAEFRIVAIIPQPKVPDLPLFILQNDITDDTFDSTMTGSHDLQRQILVNYKDYIGQLVTVRYRERTKEGKPFHYNIIKIGD